jgi:hypothetical protein
VTWKLLFTTGTSKSSAIDDKPRSDQRQLIVTLK